MCGSARSNRIFLPARETHFAPLAGMHEKECPFLVPPAERATPQCPYLIAHLIFVAGWETRWARQCEVPRRVRPVSTRGSNQMVMAETAEDLCKRPEIRKELVRATGEKRREKVEPASSDKY